MDRELVLAGLTVTTIGTSLLMAGFWPQRIDPSISAREWERASWRAVWVPLVPAVLVVSVLVGWAIMEPAESDEHLPSSVFVVSGLFVALWSRAAIRAAASLNTRDPDVAGTVGLWRTRTVISDALVTALDADALAAARAHEAAHVRHRDPLRVWLAQVVTDLQWPWPAAHDRFERWRHALELARDEEARLAGVDGADLAAAILVAARLQTSCARGAALIDRQHGLEERIGRLLAPVPTEDLSTSMSRHTLALAPMALLGVLSGVRFGEGFVQTVVKWLP